MPGANNAAVKFLMARLQRPTEVGARALVLGVAAGVEAHGKYLPDGKIKELKGMTACKEGAELQKRVWDELKLKLETIRPGVTNLA